MLYIPEILGSTRRAQLQLVSLGMGAFPAQRFLAEVVWFAEAILAQRQKSSSQGKSTTF